MLIMISEEANRVHKEAVVIDTHCDSLGYVLRGERTLRERNSQGHVDFPRLREGGITAQVFASGIHVFGSRSSQPTQLFLRMADAFYRELEVCENLALPATTNADIMRAKQEGKVAAILGMEDGAPIAGDLGILRMFYRLGLRVVCLVWGPKNEIGDGVSKRVDPGNGLTPFGISLIAEMNRLGMLIDVAHLNEKGFWDVVEHSGDPFIDSHANARRLYDHPRNLTDEQIRAVAQKGGVVHALFTFLDANPAHATLERLLDHIEYMVDLVGPAHVGIGSDIDGLSAGAPTGIEDATCFPRITNGLLSRGFHESAVKAILGGNFLRLFGMVTERNPPLKTPLEVQTSG